MLDFDLQDTRDKIEKLCNENDLNFEFESSNFPIVAALSPSEESKNQLVIDFKDDGRESNFVNGEIQFIFGDELTMKVLNDFRIEEGLLNRIKNMIKKLHYIYLQLYFKEKMKTGGALNE